MCLKVALKPFYLSFTVSEAAKERVKPVKEGTVIKVTFAAQISFIHSSNLIDIILTATFLGAIFNLNVTGCKECYGQVRYKV